jgi:hypothetical protein
MYSSMAIHNDAGRVGCGDGGDVGDCTFLTSSQREFAKACTLPTMSILGGFHVERCSSAYL